MSSTSEQLQVPAATGAPTAGWGRDAKVIALISAAHFTSHVHLMLLPPIFDLVKEAFGVSYFEIGVAITTYNVVSATLQTPAGFLVDRVGPRAMLTGGLLLGATALIVAALLPAYAIFVVAYALLGLANTVYHPSDYSILSATISDKRMGKAFSIHNFAGFLGSGVTPAAVLAIAAVWGWQGAFLAAAILAICSALLLIVAGGILPRSGRLSPSAGRPATKVGLDLLLSPPVLRNLLFFVCIAMANGGIQTFSVVALGALHGTPASVANMGLSGFLLFSAAGVLVGGIIADRTPHHEWVAAVGFACTSTMAVLMGWVDMPSAVLIFVMSLGGLLNGIIQPSRDMMVRAVTPVGSFGKVFGFVSTGFNLGGVVAPLLYGWLMDRGQPQMIFAIVTVFILLGLVIAITRRKPQAAAWTR
jgi:FSR family fosmidomycin resistance protein-like MFS transporter